MKLPPSNKPKRPRTRKVLLTVLLLLVAVPVLLLLLEHFRGKRMLAATLAELRARGEVLDITRIAPPPVPSASNALDRLIAAAEAMTSGIGRGRGQMSMQTIGPARAIAASQLEWWIAHDGSRQSWSDVADWIKTNTAAFAELHAALGAPYRRPVVDYSQGFDTLLPYLSPVKAGLLRLDAAAGEAAHRNDFNGALVQLEGMKQIEQDLAELPMLIDQLVRIACAAIANNRAWDILHAQEWSEPELAALQAALPPSELVGGIVHAFQGERALVLMVIQNDSGMDQWAFREHSVEPGQESAPGLEDWFTRQFDMLLAGVWHFAWSDQAAAHFLVSMQALIDLNREASRARSAGPLNRFRMGSLLEADSSLARSRTFYTRTFLPALDKASIKALRCETERALLLTGIALRRFQLSHSQYPERLDQLVPEFLAAVPIDRMDGQTVRYRLNPDRTFTLWSIGEDFVDNGGDPTSTRPSDHPSLDWWLARDAVWPAPASEEELEAWTRKETEKLKNLRPGGSYERLMLERYGVLPGQSATNALAPSN